MINLRKLCPIVPDIKKAAMRFDEIVGCGDFNSLHLKLRFACYGCHVGGIYHNVGEVALYLFI